MKKILFLSLLTTAFSLSAQTNFQVQEKLERLENDLTQLQRQVYQKSGSGTDNDSIPDIWEKLEAQEKQLRTLTDAVETLTFQNKQLTDKLQTINADMDLRFKELSANANTTVKSTITTPDELPKTSASAQEAYDAAYKLIKDGKYAQASRALDDFLHRYPDSELCANATYWLAETYYIDGKYPEALTYFSKGLTDYKDSNKAPDCLLKVGLSMQKLGKTKDACTAFKSLPERYPHAVKSIRDRAKQEQKALACP